MTAPLATLASRWIAALILALALWSTPAAAQQAQGEPAAPSGPAAGASAEELESLLATLKDDAERQRFISHLETLVEAKRQAAGEEASTTPAPGPDGLGSQLLAALSARLDVVTRQLGQAVDAIAALPGALAVAWERAQDPAVRGTWLEMAGKVVLVLLAGFLAEWLARRVLARPRRLLEGRSGDMLLLRAVYLLARTVLDMVPIALFAAAAYAVLPMTEPRRVTQLVALTLVNANLLARVAMALARAVFAPLATGLRLLPMSDETANYAVIWVRRLSIVGIYGYFVSEAALLLGLAPGAYALVLKAVGLVIAGMLTVLLLQNRVAFAAWLRGKGEAPGALQSLRGRLAELWHVLAILYVFAVYGVWALDIGGGFAFLLRATVLTIVVLVLARVIGLALERGITRIFRLSDELRERYPRLEARANRYVPVLHRLLRIVVTVVAVLLLLQIWGADVFGWLASGVGRELVGRVVTVAFIVAVAFALWEVVSAFVERALERQSEGGGVSARALTLLPLMRNAVRVVLAVLVTLIVLSELGVDIAPLLAGAGVVGLAVGFGAQTLVKDIITGTFVLLENSVAIGDWVELGGHSGGVEALTVRTITLRDLNGSVHTVPWGEVTTVLNYGRDYGYSVIDVGVAYREDVDEVIKVMEQVGEEMRADPDWSDRVLEPLEVLGLNKFGDSAIEIRARLKTRPLKQWGARREFLRRLKRAFDERGIEIPFPHRTIYFGVDKQGAAPPARIEMQQADTPPSVTAAAEPAEAPSVSDTPTDKPEES